MTGLDCLREEMAKRGCNKAQIESKAVAVVLDILSNGGTINTDVWEAEHKLKWCKYEHQAEENRHEREIKSIQTRLANMREQTTSLMEEAREYIEAFNKSLSECESAEGRDAMRRAQVFVNSVDVDTKYDNTAYIIGLAAILSDGKMGAINELKKFNPKMVDKNCGRI